MAGVIYVLLLGAIAAAFVSALLALLAARERRAARAPRPPMVQARVLCPILDCVTRVRLGVGPADARLGVRWCERFGEAPLRCDRSCFGAAIAESLVSG